MGCYYSRPEPTPVEELPKIEDPDAPPYIHEGNKYLKKLKESEFEFLEMEDAIDIMDDDLLSIINITPNYHSYVERFNTRYIMQRHLTFGFSFPNYMQCKLGKITWTSSDPEEKVERCKEKNANSTTDALGFRIKKYKIVDEEGKLIDQLTESSEKITTDNILEYFKNFILFDYEIPQIRLRKFIELTIRIQDWFKKKRKKKFIGCSVFYTNGKKNNYDVRLINFNHVIDGDIEEDTNVVQALESIINYWKKLLDRPYEEEEDRRFIGFTIKPMTGIPPINRNHTED